LQVRASSYNSNKLNNYMTTVSQVYYLTFTCGSTCFGRLHAHNQELTTALAASGFTVGAWWSEAATAVVELLIMGVRTLETY
jgi:hypothetical protein